MADLIASVALLIASAVTGSTWLIWRTARVRRDQARSLAYGLHLDATGRARLMTPAQAALVREHYRRKWITSGDPADLERMNALTNPEG